MNLLKLLDTLSPQVRNAFLESIADLRSQAQLATVVGHLESGNIDLALAALNIRQEFFAPLDRALSDAYLQGGREALAGLPALTDPLAVAAWLRGWTCETQGPKRS